MNRTLRLIAALATFLAAAGASGAAEIVLEHSAVDKLLAQTGFAPVSWRASVSNRGELASASGFRRGRWCRDVLQRVEVS